MNNKSRPYFTVKFLGLSLDIQNREDVHASAAKILDQYDPKDPSRSLALLKNICKDRPQDMELNRLLVVLLFKNNKHNDCVSHCASVAAQILSDPIIPLLYGISLARSKKEEAAAKTLVRFLAKTVGLTPKGEGQQSDKELFLNTVKLILADQKKFLNDFLVLATGDELGRINYYQSISQSLSEVDGLEFLGNQVPPQSIDYSVVRQFSRFLGFSSCPSATWRTQLFEKLFLSEMKKCVVARRFDDLLALEIWIYNHYVKFVETEDHFRAAYTHMAPILESAGAAAQAESPYKRAWTPVQGRPQRIVFILNQVSWLAHVVTLLETVECIQAYAPQAFEFHIIGLTTKVAPMAAEACDRLGVQLHFAFKTLSATTDGLMHNVTAVVRRICDDIEADAAVWVSAPECCHVAFAYRVAPVQIYFSMKFKTIAPKYADGLLALHSVAEPIKRYGDLEWRMGRMYLPDLFDASLAEAAKELRAKFSKFRLLTACIGRDEKINSPKFLSTVVTLLQCNPDVAFVWTGAVRNQSIVHAFQNGGVLDQTFYVGWVDTKLYAQAIDLFLDSFPFPCGRTAFETMAAGNPVVFFRSEEALSTGVIMTIDPLLNGTLGNEEDRKLMRDIFIDQQGRNLMPIADTAEEFSALAQQLIEDSDLRKDAGKAQKRFIESFMTNKVGCGRVFVRHLQEMLTESG